MKKRTLRIAFATMAIVAGLVLYMMPQRAVSYPTYCWYPINDNFPDSVWGLYDGNGNPVEDWDGHIIEPYDPHQMLNVCGSN